MKKLRKFLVVLCAFVLMAACVLTASASSITRKFNGFHAVNKDNPNLYTTDGTSTYQNGIVTCNFSKTGAGCWQYISDVENLHFQLKIDTDCDPEFDWLGVNITNDGSAFLGEGTGLSTLIWRTTSSVNCRLVQSADGAAWDNVANQELISGELYTGESDALTAPYEDFRWGDGDWIDFKLDKDSNNSWHLYVNGIDIIRNPYKSFDTDMDKIFGNADKVTLSLFLSNATGVVQVRGVDDNQSGNTTGNSENNTTGNNNTAGTTSTDGTSSGNISDSSNKTPTSGTDNATTGALGDDGTTNVSDDTEPDVVDTDTSTDDIKDTSNDIVNDTNEKAEQNHTLLIVVIIVAVVVLAAAGVAFYFFIIKKK